MRNACFKGHSLFKTIASAPLARPVHADHFNQGLSSRSWTRLALCRLLSIASQAQLSCPSIRDPDTHNCRPQYTGSPRPPCRSFSTTSSNLARRRTAPPPARPGQPVSASQRASPIESQTASHLSAIFGTPIAEPLGNRLLRILHRRRTTGSLIDLGLTFTSPDLASALPRENLDKGLGWLREQYPVDEEAAAEAWVEGEARRLQDGYIARGVSLGLLKPIEEGKDAEGGRVSARRRRKAEAEDDAASSASGAFGADPRRSVLEALKRVGDEQRAQEKRKEDRQAREALKAARGGKSGPLEKVDGLRGVAAEGDYKTWMGSSALEAKEGERTEAQKQLARQGREPEWVAYYRKRAVLSERVGKEPPDMTVLRRLGPSVLLGLSLVCMTIYGAYNYIPPAQGQRYFPDISPAVATLGLLTAVNLIVFLGWRIPPLWRAWNKYMILVPGAPYAASILGNIFSHHEFMHMSSNLMALWAYGWPLHDWIGRGNFVALYLATGLFGSMASLSLAVSTRAFQYWHLGASGSIWGIMLAWAAISYSYGLPDVKSVDLATSADIARWAVIGFSVLAHLVPGASHTYDFGAHAGGAMSGFVWAEVLKRRAAAKKKLEDY